MDPVDDPGPILRMARRVGLLIPDMEELTDQLRQNPVQGES